MKAHSDWYYLLPGNEIAWLRKFMDLAKFSCFVVCTWYRDDHPLPSLPSHVSMQDGWKLYRKRYTNPSHKAKRFQGTTEKIILVPTNIKSAPCSSQQC